MVSRKTKFVLTFRYCSLEKMDDCLGGMKIERGVKCVLQGLRYLSVTAVFERAPGGMWKGREEG